VLHRMLHHTGERRLLLPEGCDDMGAFRAELVRAGHVPHGGHPGGDMDDDECAEEIAGMGVLLGVQWIRPLHLQRAPFGVNMIMQVTFRGLVLRMTGDSAYAQRFGLDFYSRTWRRAAIAGLPGRAGAGGGAGRERASGCATGGFGATCAGRWRGCSSRQYAAKGRCQADNNGAADDDEQADQGAQCIAAVSMILAVSRTASKSMPCLYSLIKSF